MRVKGVVVITNLEESLKQGNLFPPVEDADRIAKYMQYDALWNNDITLAFPSTFNKLKEDMIWDDRYFKDVFNPIVVPFCKLIPKKKVDLTFGEFPVVVHTTDPKKEKEINNVLKETRFWSMIKRAALDCEIKGNGVYMVYNKEPIYISNNDTTKSEAAVRPIDPLYWTCLVDEFNPFNIKSNIIGSVTTYDNADKGKKSYKIQINAYYNDKVEERVFECSEPQPTGCVVLGKQIGETKTIAKTPTSRNLVKVLTNYSTSADGIIGISGYESYKDIVKEIIERFTQIAKVLDKHVIPTITGPASALSEDKITGKKYFKKGAYIALSPADASIKVEYLTWDAKLESAFNEIDRLVGMLYQLSETGAPFLDGDVDKIGFAESARALKIRHKSPIAAAKAWMDDNKYVIIQSIADLCKINGVDVDWSDLEINWKINLPEDELEKAQISATKVGAKISSIVEENIRQGMDREGAEEEFKSVLEEQRKIKLNTLDLEMKNSNNANDDKEKDGVDGRKFRTGATNLSAEQQRKSNDQIGSPNKPIKV